MVTLLAVQTPLFATEDATPTGAAGDTPEFESCSIGNDTATVPAQCTTITVPFSYDNSDETLDVFVAKIPAKQSPAADDPLVLIAGGPGQAATEAFPALLHSFRDIAQTRDLILIDQRGTGESHRLDCDASVPGEDLEFDRELAIENSKKCLAALDKDPHYFTTSIAVKDLEEIRDRLGVDAWNLYGVSYGTRVALHFMRRFPDRVRSAILDGVVPPDSALSAEFSIHAQQSLDKLYSFCESSPDCQESFPELRTQTMALLERLDEAPISVDYEDVSTGRMRQLDFTSAHLSITLRLMTYSSYGVAILPSMLHEAYENENFTQLARQANMQTESLDSSIASGMHNAVFCTEDPPENITDAQRKQATASYISDWLVEALQSNCEPWPKGAIDSDFKEPFESNIPTLVLSGAADPITPASYGQRVADKLSNSLHIVNEHQSHMQLPIGCVAKVAARFIDQPNPETIDTQCLERLRPPAFFIDANGPKP